MLLLTLVLLLTFFVVVCVLSDRKMQYVVLIQTILITFLPVYVVNVKYHSQVQQ